MSYEIAREMVQRCFEVDNTFSRCYETCLSYHSVYSDCLGVTLFAWWNQFNTDQKLLYFVGIPLGVLLFLFWLVSLPSQFEEDRRRREREQQAQEWERQKQAETREREEVMIWALEENPVLIKAYAEELAQEFQANPAAAQWYPRLLRKFPDLGKEIWKTRPLWLPSPEDRVIILMIVIIAIIFAGAIASVFFSPSP